MNARALFVFFLVALALMPIAAHAASSNWLPIIPCGSSGQPPCTPCSLFETAKRATDFILYGLTGPVAAFMFVFAGGMLLLGAGNPGMQLRARALLTNTAMGVGIILLAWLSTDFLIKNLATGSVADSWNQFTCPTFLQQTATVPDQPLAIPARRALSPEPQNYNKDPNTLTEAEKQQLAKSYNNARYPLGASSSLLNLISCIRRDPKITLIAKSKIYTTDESNPVCNYTRGNPIGSGSCSHAVNSCHYGGEKGTNGAEAVDMSGMGGTVPTGKNDKEGKPILASANTSDLFCELVDWLVNKHQCPDFKFINWEGDHVHVSTRACSNDGAGISQNKGTTRPTCAFSPGTPK